MKIQDLSVPITIVVRLEKRGLNERKKKELKRKKKVTWLGQVSQMGYKLAVSFAMFWNIGKILQYKRVE